MLVSTSYRPSAETVRASKRLAAELGCRYVGRENLSLGKLGLKHNDSEILVVSGSQLKYYQGQNKPLFFHPSMAYLRLGRLLKREKDPLLEASAAAPGDTVLDCTAGLASDAIVFSYAVGARGKVVALDSEEVIAVLLQWGIRRYESDLAPLNEALRRIEIKHEEHLSYLRGQPDSSVDIVYFDPMFRYPVKDCPSMLPMRETANAVPVAPEAIREARRVARKTVVLKELCWSKEFARLGFDQVIETSSKIAYGVIRL